MAAKAFAFILVLVACISQAWGQSTESDTPTTLIVGTRHVPPFSIKQEDGEWTGLSIDLWRQVAKDLQLDYQLREYREVGSLLDAVRNEEVDVAIAAITITAEREEGLDFTHAYYSSGIGVAVRKRRGLDWISAVGSLMSIDMLIVFGTIGVFILIAGIVTWGAERNANSDDFHQQPVRGIWDGVWWAAVTMTTVGYGDKAPKTFVGRVNALVWMFIGLVAITILTGTVASILTTSQLRPAIRRPADLANVRTCTILNSTSEDFLKREHLSYQSFDDVTFSIDQLRKGHVDAIVYDAPTLRHLAHRDYGGVVEVLPVRFQEEGYAIAVKPRSPLREPINRELLKIIRSPEWKAIVADYVGR